VFLCGNPLPLPVSMCRWKQEMPHEYKAPATWAALAARRSAYRAPPARKNVEICPAAQKPSSSVASGPGATPWPPSQA